MWEIDDVSIKFKPLTDAFNALFHISYIKVLFDENYDGRSVQVSNVTVPGTAATAQIRLINPTSASVIVPAGEYVFNDGLKDWSMEIDSDTEIPADDNIEVRAAATAIGDDAQLSSGDTVLTDLTPSLPSDIEVSVLSVQQGTNASVETMTVPSMFFDTALALAYLCKLNLKLSYFVNMVKISYVDRKPNPADRCWIRLKTSAEQKENMLSVKDGDRIKYYWAALYLMGCVQNTWTLVHSEPVNIMAQILAAWFAARNDSGQYVGNKLSLLRLRGTKIKPLGFPSWLNSEVNENDEKGFDQLDEMNVGYLFTISDNTPQESNISSARSIDGTPLIAQMISKWVDYTSSQQVARLLTETETLTKPVLNNEETYSRIQNTLFSNLMLFVPVKRVSNIQLKFPPFPVARVNLRSLVATGSWTAGYTDELDSVTISGGLTVA